MSGAEEGEEGWKAKYEALQEEYAGFRASSSELEAELERELSGASDEVERLANAILKTRERAEKEGEQAAKRAAELEADAVAQRRRADEAEARLGEAAAAARRMEQDKDDLERRLRAAEAATEDYQMKLEAALEENILLQTEVDELTGGHAEHTERLKAQLSEVKQELSALQARAGRSPVAQRATAAELRASEKRRAAASRGGGEWYLLESGWMEQWKKFILGAGGRPGPLTNGPLLDEGGAVRASLVYERDYVAVRPQVWRKLHGLYGGTAIRNAMPTAEGASVV